ncbi:hypothetical protein [Fusobacterium animalis]
MEQKYKPIIAILVIATVTGFKKRGAAIGSSPTCSPKSTLE